MPTEETTIVVLRGTSDSEETWIGMVRRIAQLTGRPVPDDELASSILWNRTAFPFAPPDHIEGQLYEFFDSVVSPCFGTRRPVHNLESL